MKIFTRFISVLMFAASTLFVQAVAAQEPTILVTSSGQALDAFTVKTMLGRAKIENNYDPVATSDDLDGVDVVIIAVGASIKGFGAAGITADSEIARTQALIDEAKKQNIKVIGVHIGGMDRRAGLSEQFVTLVANNADALIVSKNGDSDGYFTEVAAERDIPLTVINLPINVGDAVAEQLAQN